MQDKDRIGSIEWNALGESRKCRKGRKGGYCPFQVLGHDKEFFVATELFCVMSWHGFLCHDKVGKFGPGDRALVCT